MKTTGKQFKEFYYSPDSIPGDDAYIDYLEINVDGKYYDHLDDGNDIEDIPDSSIVNLISGIVVLDSGETKSLATVYKKWLKDQTHDTFLVTCGKSDTLNLQSIIIKYGGSVK